MSRSDEVLRRRLKYVATLNDEALGDDTDPDFELRYVDISNVESSGRILEPETMRFSEAPSRARRRVRDGDVLVSCVRTYLQAIAPVHAPPDNLIVSTGFAVVRPRGSMLAARFAKYALREPAFIGEVVSRSVGVSYPAINSSDLGDIAVALPSLPYQRAIADYLDRETARLDALVAAKERTLHLLVEKRRSLISHAVASGVQPNVGVRDSGLAWMGAVPSHWDVVPFGAAIWFQEGPGIMAVDFRDAGIPLLRIAGVQGRWATLDGCNYLDPTKVARTWNHFRVQAGDLLISASASMGTVCEVGAEAHGAVPYTGLIRMAPRGGRVTRDFIRAILGSDVFATQIDLMAAGATIQHFGPSHLRQMKIPLPPLEEQKDITEYLERTTSAVDGLVASIQRSIDLLRERRSALISAAVTGALKIA